MKRWEWVDGCYRHEVGGKGWALICPPDRRTGRVMAGLTIYQDAEGMWTDEFDNMEEALRYADALIAGLTADGVLAK